eukprot:TRINITY_DN486_c1_g1_i3.p1 TRINITY_DN486_c1_g1~~TRINITY_DN486_c1_g1_i3.p1  ORF type:complete len:688 (-),score=172.88 TRINITY_DN486_c1_g1_i3:358-2421(-)
MMVGEKQFTIKAIISGICIGALLCFSNMYFGLQTGWVTMGSLQASIVVWAVFRLVRRKLSAFENNISQTIAVATATMPLAGGFVGIIPAMMMFKENPQNLSVGELILWTFSVSLFGVFVAVPLRQQLVIKEKLTFPSGTATYEIIKTLHSKDTDEDNHDSDPLLPMPINGTKQSKWQSLFAGSEFKVLIWWFTLSGFWTMLSYFLPVFRTITLIGAPVMLLRWHWYFTMSGSYIAQGIIMGTKAALSMGIGAFLGWGFIGPIAKGQGLVDDIDDWTTGVQGFLMWLALAVLMAHACWHLLVQVVRIIYKVVKHIKRKRQEKYLDIEERIEFTDDYQTGSNESTGEQDPLPIVLPEDNDQSKSKKETQLQLTTPVLVDSTNAQSSEKQVDNEPKIDPKEEIPNSWWITGLVVSSILCAITVPNLFEMSYFEPLLAVLVGVLVSFLAVRCLGETDLNPVSGVGKISQIAFAVISPHKVVSNLVAGAIAEAGAQQAGDMMQSLKTGYLLEASPKKQFFGQLIGSVFSAVITVFAFKLFTSEYSIPGSTFPVPTAYMWLEMSKVLSGEADLPSCYMIGAAIAFILAFIVCGAEHYSPEKAKKWFPSLVSMAIGLYLTPNWTLPRVLGGALAMVWKMKYPKSAERWMLPVASGLVLGEGVLSTFSAGLKSASVGPISCFGCSDHAGICPGCN